MVNKEEKYRYIDRYVRGELTGKQLAMFRELMRVDTDFAGEVALHRRAAELIDEARTQHLRSSMEQVGKAFDSSLTPAQRFIYIAVAVTGVLVAAVVASYLLLV